MTQPHPHPQRCETCKKYSERTHPIYEGNIIAFCGEERTQVETKAITSNHGCASHSSASEPVAENCPHWKCGTCNKSFGLIEEEARKEERERVIQQFIDFEMSGKCVKTDKAVSCDAICERDCFVCFAESLRGGDAP